MPKLSIRWSSLCLLFVSLLAFTEGTRTWHQASYEELEKGTAKGVAVRSEGGLELAPAFKSVYTTPSTYIWSIADDAQGNVFAAAGAPARVYRITPDGKATVIFQPRELQVQALVADKDGAIFAVNMLVGTSGGNTYTYDEIEYGLTRAGFNRVRLLQSGEHMDGLVEAFKS